MQKCISIPVPHFNLPLILLTHLRSADSLAFNIPRTRMGDRALLVTGKRNRNALPADIRCAPSLDISKKHLKSHLFFCL